MGYIHRINDAIKVTLFDVISNKRTKHNLDSTYLWHCRLERIIKKRIAKLQHDGLLKPTDDESFYKCISYVSGKMACYPKEMMGYYFYYPPENKIFVAQYAELFENGLISQEEIGSNVDLEVI
ncbi:retrotransposon protein, putative, ty1-copia subclass [Tanacetum coccineum]